MQPLSQEVEDLLIPEPFSSPEVNGPSTGLEQDHMATVLQGRHIAVERLPVVGDDRHSAGGRELVRDLVAQQGRGIGMPTDLFDRLALGLGT
jgi:hypothetical protein